MSEAFSVVIPARYASTRLPAKPLALIGGRPMILLVVEQAIRSGARDVVVATDHEEVRAVVAGQGFDVVMTRADHASGSDRVMEVVSQRGWPDRHIVINVQGDEPRVPPAVIDQVAKALDAAPEVPVATLCERLTEGSSLFDSNVVKVVRRQDGRALYFSRAPIPWWRDGFMPDASGERLLEGAHWWRHIGIYGFRVEGLKRFCAAPAGQLEALEALEQLRMLEIGMDIIVDEAVTAVPAGVDTASDLARLNDSEQ